MTRTLLRWHWLLLPFLLAAGAGCGPSGPVRVAVEGTVNIDGQPVPDGVISFIPAEGTTGPTAGGAIVNGRYKIAPADGPVIGKHRVEITGQRKTGRVYDSLPPHKVMIEEKEPVVPAKYSTMSELSAELKSGMNKYDWDLKSEN
ncbi:MAG: hypothetical protein ACT4QC_18315 [Planctomycetaceae bacterium]